MYVDSADLARAKSVLGNIPGAAPKAVCRALNRAAAGAKTAAKKEIKNKYTVKMQKIGAKMAVERATSGSMNAAVITNGPATKVSYFKFTPSSPAKRGKTPFVQVKKAGGGQVKDTFVAKMKSGHTGVFARFQDGTKGTIKKYMAGGNPRAKQHGKGQTKGRAALRELYGPALPKMMKNPQVISAMQEKAEEVFPERLEHEIDYLLGKVGK